VPVTIKQPPAPQDAIPPESPQEAAEADTPKKGESDDKIPKDAMVELVDEYGLLQKEVRDQWKSWQELAASLGPKIESMKSSASSLRALVSSVRDLQIPDIHTICRKLASCDECAASSVCGWCTSTLRCVPGTRDGILEPGACDIGVEHNPANAVPRSPGRAKHNAPLTRCSD